MSHFLHINNTDCTLTWWHELWSKLLATVILVELLSKKEIISVLTKLDYYYTLEAMQHAGSISLYKNVNIHRYNREGLWSKEYLATVNSNTMFVFVFSYLFSSHVLCLFMFIITASFTWLAAYCGLCGLHTQFPHFYMYLWVLIHVTEGHERSHIEMFTEEVIVSLQLIILLFVNK